MDEAVRKYKRDRLSFTGQVAGTLLESASAGRLDLVNHILALKIVSPATIRHFVVTRLGSSSAAVDVAIKHSLEAYASQVPAGEALPLVKVDRIDAKTSFTRVVKRINERVVSLAKIEERLEERLAKALAAATAVPDAEAVAVLLNYALLPRATLERALATFRSRVKSLGCDDAACLRTLSLLELAVSTNEPTRPSRQPGTYSTLPPRAPSSPYGAMPERYADRPEVPRAPRTSDYGAVAPPEPVTRGYTADSGALFSRVVEHWRFEDERVVVDDVDELLGSLEVLGGGVVARPSTISGTGLFAARSFLAGAAITEFAGRRVERVGNALGGFTRALRVGHAYLEGDLVPVAGRGGGSAANDTVDVPRSTRERALVRTTARHNARYVIVTDAANADASARDFDAQRAHLILVASEPIAPGDEIFVDYGEAFWRSQHDIRRVARPRLFALTMGDLETSLDQSRRELFGGT